MIVLINCIEYVNNYIPIFDNMVDNYFFKPLRFLVIF